MKDFFMGFIAISMLFGLCLLILAGVTIFYIILALIWVLRKIYFTYQRFIIKNTKHGKSY